MVSLGSNAILSEINFSTSGGKEKEKTDHARIVYWLNKLLSAARCHHDLFLCFSGGVDDPRENFTEQAFKGKFNVTIASKGTYGLVEHPEKATHGWNNNLTKRGNDDAVLPRKDGTVINTNNCYVLYLTPSVM